LSSSLLVKNTAIAKIGFPVKTKENQNDPQGKQSSNFIGLVMLNPVTLLTR